MQVYKCDKCKKTIQDSAKKAVRVSLGFYNRYELCPKCAEPIAKILKHYKLDVYEEDKE